jgi:hypothetical protein
VGQLFLRLARRHLQYQLCNVGASGHNQLKPGFCLYLNRYNVIHYKDQWHAQSFVQIRIGWAILGHPCTVQDELEESVFFDIIMPK